MHVGRQGNVGAEAFLDIFEIGCLAYALSGEAHQVGAGVGYGLDLGHTGIGVVGVGVGHGLYGNRGVASDCDAAHTHRKRAAAAIVIDRHNSGL